MALQEDIAARAPAVPFVYGSIAMWLGKKNPPQGEHTHKWSVFLRSPHDHDLSYAIAKVEINLHPSFVNPTRVFTAPPYVVSETGWGEFEVSFRIFLRDTSAEPITLMHRLALYPPNQVYTERPVLSEHYDELVFNALPADPQVRGALLSGPQRLAPAYPYGELLLAYTDDDDSARVEAARVRLGDLRAEMHDRLARAKVELERTKDELRAMGAV